MQRTNTAKRELCCDFTWYWNISHWRNGEAISVDDIKSDSQGESRGATKLVKIAEDAREFVAKDQRFTQRYSCPARGFRATKSTWKSSWPPCSENSRKVTLRSSRNCQERTHKAQRSKKPVKIWRKRSRWFCRPTVNWRKSRCVERKSFASHSRSRWHEAARFTAPPREAWLRIPAWRWLSHDLY